MSGHRCGGCGSMDGTPGFTIGATLCYPCRVARNERREAYYAARARDEQVTTALFAATIIGFALVLVACVVATLA